MTYTHDQLVAAVEEERPPLGSVLANSAWVRERNAYLDTLAAVLELHTMGTYRSGETFCDVCVSDTSGIVWWPCPTVAIVVDALTRMGALPP
jgi:hypothetical protein